MLKEMVNAPKTLIHLAIIFFSVSEDSAQLDGVSSLCDIRGPASAGLCHDDVINAPRRRRLGGRWRWHNFRPGRPFNRRQVWVHYITFPIFAFSQLKIIEMPWELDIELLKMPFTYLPPSFAWFKRHIANKPMNTILSDQSWLSTARSKHRFRRGGGVTSVAARVTPTVSGRWWWSKSQLKVTGAEVESLSSLTDTLAVRLFLPAAKRHDHSLWFIGWSR